MVVATLITIVGGVSVAVGYLAMDYCAARQTRRFANVLKNHPEFFEGDREIHNLLQNEVDEIVGIMGPFTYHARKYYRSVVD